MEIVFFDYYHPYAGLCNQLYLITNHINLCLVNSTQIYIHRFNTDIFKKTRKPFDSIFDIPKTNENLKRLTGISIISIKQPEIIKRVPQLQIYPVSSIPILNCLEFNKKFLDTAAHVKRYNLKNEKYNGIHFRMEIDCILHYTFGKTVYDTFMDLANRDISQANRYFESLDQNKIKRYCEFLMEQYIKFIKQFGFDKTWYICSSLLKSDIHKPFRVYLKQIVEFINSNNGTSFISYSHYPERELNALVDLLILRDSEKMIGFEGSSFSEGYCYKVNQIRKVTKEFVFVKERNEIC